MAPLYEHAHAALNFVLFIGATTAFFAGTVGLVQNDIKRVIAYSTCSQLGYMFVGLGLGAYETGMFHLFTHAFFKALLFLGAGSVIHAVSDEQDMRRMGGLRTHIPVTYWMMVIGTLSLTGFPFTAGNYSKHAIIEAAYAVGTSISGYAFVLTVIAAVMTSFYSWRLIFMTFHGRPNASPEVMKHVHESPLVMLIPLGILAAGSILAGLLFAGTFIGDESKEFWGGALRSIEGVLEATHHVPFWVQESPTVALIVGFAIAVYFYLVAPDVPRRLAERHDWLYRFLLNKWYFDELYDFLFVRSAKWLGRFLWKQGDGWLIDGFGPDGVSARVIDVTNRVVRLQSGYLYHYAFAMLIGLAALITYITFAP
jgi:NADH-quinone oxidoreductase subunit L